MKSQPIVSALVLNYRNVDQAVRCVRLLQEQTWADRLEIIVIDNHSEDGSVTQLESAFADQPNVRILALGSNGGFGHGCNAGARSATGRYLLINNPDKVLQPDGIERLVTRMETEPTIGILGPQLRHADGTRRLSIRRFPRWFDVVANRLPWLKPLFRRRLRRYLCLDLDPDVSCDVDWVVGGCLLMRRELFARIGGFDERFFLFFEDTDLCRRCWQTGHRVVYEASVTATDKKRRLSEGGAWSLVSTRVGRAHLRSAMTYFWRWRGQPNPRLNSAASS